MGSKVKESTADSIRMPGEEVDQAAASADSSPIPWEEMFQTAAKPLAAIPRNLHASRSSPALGYQRSSRSSLGSSLRLHGDYKSDDEVFGAMKPPRPHSVTFQKTEEETSRMSNPNILSNGSRDPSATIASSYEKNSLSDQREERKSSNNFVHNEEQEEEEEEGVWKFNRASFQLALYIAMAHAGLVFVVVVLYGVLKLLEDYRKPIQWAVLCSMPLREIHGTLVTFWERPLRKGLVETVLAIPLAIFRALIGTIMDARVAVHYLLGKSRSRGERKIRFSTLMQWLVSFAFFTLGYDLLGPAPLAIVAFLGMILYAAGTSLGLIVPVSGHLEIQASWSILSAKNSHRGRQAGSWLGWVLSPFIEAYKFINTRLTRAFLEKLHTLVAIGLIFMMIFGSFAGLVLFSYKVGLEGKDAVVALKSHVQKSNYAERVGLKQWIEDNKIPDLIDTYTAKAYETVSDQIDVFAANYNMTELAGASKQYILGFARGQITSANVCELSPQALPSHPVLKNLENVRIKLREYDMKGVYSELEQAALILLEHFQISKEELIEKAKLAGQRWLNVGKQVMASSSTLITGSTSMLFSIGSAIASGAVEVANFFTQAVVFFYVLFYLITSETGGVMDHVLGMVPLTESTRRKCAKVLDHTVSSVLLATAKAAFFQAAFTWLLFRFFNIHFLYMSTLLALFNAVLPIFPGWLSSIPAGAQLAMDGRYVQAVLLMAAHIWVMDFGVSAIQHGIPGHNAYLTGLSIAGGIALFSPALEGAIMGPLLMTVLIALKNLYSEFILTTAKKQ